MMVSTAKLSSLWILFIMSCISGLVLPYFFLRVLARNYCQSSKIFKKVLGYMNCFSGGVFIATSLLTLLPEVREKMESVMSITGSGVEYPVTELLLGIGFLLILFIESMTATCFRKHASDHSKVNPSLDEEQLNEEQLKKEQLNEEQLNKGSDNVVTTTQGSKHSCNEFCASYQHGHATVIPVRQELRGQPETRMSPRDSEIVKQHSDHCLTENIYSQGMSNLHSFILLLALSIHMIFDGLSLGLLNTDNEVWSLLIALGIHKILIFFSTGITICESTTYVKFALVMLYMSVVSPFGVGIGIVLTSQEPNLSLATASAILQAIAVGTFVYVAFFEILLKEFTPGKNSRILKSISTVLGYTLVAVIRYSMPEH